MRSHKKTECPAISVIIPVYNTAPWLRRCLDSVCGQTLRDIEIICVNDGSTDESLDILREYAATDSRLHVLSFESNRGVSAARNTGMTIATGEYLGFVDSDDYVDADFYEKLYKTGSENDADIVVGSLSIIGCNNKIFYKESNIISILSSICLHFGTHIYKKKCIIEKNIFFPEEITNGEDYVFKFKSTAIANKICIQNDVQYFYCRRSDSSNPENLADKQIESYLESFLMIVSFINKEDICRKNYTIIFNHVIRTLLSMPSRASEETSFCKIALCLIDICSMYKFGAYSYPGELILYKRAVENRDISGLTRILTHYDSHMKRIAAGLRMRSTM